MTENIQRRLDHGEPPLVAAERGARQVFFAVVATTVVLLATMAMGVCGPARHERSAGGAQASSLSAVM